MLKPIHLLFGCLTGLLALQAYHMGYAQGKEAIDQGSIRDSDCAHYLFKVINETYMLTEKVYGSDIRHIQGVVQECKARLDFLSINRTIALAQNKTA